MGPSASVVMHPAQRLQTPWLHEVLDTIAEFQKASIGLVAWELCLPEEALGPAWAHALAQGLIVESGECSETSEAMFELAPVGVAEWAPGAVARGSVAREPAAAV